MLTLPPLLLLAAAPAAPAPLPPPASAIAEVVVYPDRAAVTRRTRVGCAEHALVRYPALPASADPASFRAQARGAVVDGLRFEERTRAEATVDRVAALARSLARLDADGRAAKEEIDRLDAQAQTAQSLQVVAERVVTSQLGGAAKPDPAAWRTAFAAVLELEVGAAAARTAAAARLRRIEAERQALAEQQTALADNGARKEYLVEVVISCAPGASAEVDLVYMVGGASWSPAYEARARERTGTLELGVLATVQQRTGEDWRSARLSLSTALPRQNATPPVIAPLAVYADEREPPRKQIVARAEEIRHTAAADPAATAATAGRARLDARGLSVQMALPEPAAVPGDGTPVRLLVARSRLPATFRLRATPRLAPHVFRVVEATNATPLPLLAGPVDIYRDRSFVARQDLEEIAAGARFSLGLGIEERVRARRVIVEEVDRAVGLLGGSRHHRFAYRFHLASYLPRPEELELGAQIPVSELDDVAVVVDARTTAGYALERRDGLVSWRLRLAPGQARTVDLAFRVEVPSRYE